MVGIFKHKNPGNALLLLLYGLALKFPLFMHPVKPVLSEGDNYIFFLITRFLSPLADNAPVVFSLLAFLLFFSQATLLNRIVNSLKLFPKPNYLVGMSFLLATSLIKEWNSFSAPLLVNSLMIWIWYRMVGLYSNNNPKTSIYNVGVLIGLVTLINTPAIAFVLLLLMALIINRPLRVPEWLVAILGMITPYYFLFVILFLTDNWQPARVIHSFTFHLPKLPESLWITGGIALLLIPFISGSYFMQLSLNKMMIQVRKAWSLLLVFLIISLLVIVVNPAADYRHWMYIAVPISTFHAATYYYLRSRWVALLLHWLIFVYAVLVNYQVIN